MKVNWNRYIIEHLPIALRKVGIYALLLVLLSPVIYVYNKYLSYSDRMRKQSSYTPQVCMLVKIIHDELGLTASIKEENGKPYDFSIDVTVANTDVERRLIALISKYKLAGKNFLLNNAAVTWVQSWGGYVCEEIMVPSVNNVVFTKHWKYDVDRKKQVIYKVAMHADEALSSELKIDIVLYTSDDPQMGIPASFYFQAGESAFETIFLPMSKIEIQDYSPKSDSEYEYSLTIEDKYE